MMKHYFTYLCYYQVEVLFLVTFPGKDNGAESTENDNDNASRVDGK